MHATLVFNVNFESGVEMMIDCVCVYVFKIISKNNTFEDLLPSVVVSLGSCSRVREGIFPSLHHSPGSLPPSIFRLILGVGYLTFG